jgi:hypothetical protein
MKKRDCDQMENLHWLMRRMCLGVKTTLSLEVLYGELEVIWRAELTGGHRTARTHGNAEVAVTEAADSAGAAGAAKAGLVGTKGGDYNKSSSGTGGVG